MTSEAEKAMELMGQLTMCWDPVPSGVLDSTEAIRISGEIFSTIKQHILAEAEKKKVEADFSTTFYHVSPEEVVKMDDLKEICGVKDE